MIENKKKVLKNLQFKKTTAQKLMTITIMKFVGMPYKKYVRKTNRNIIF